MNPSARLAAAIEVLGVTEEQRRPVADVLRDWGRSHRFAGAKDRAAILDPATGIVDPARVRKRGMAPIIDLAILDAAGETGLVGRGAYVTPLELFAETAA